MTYIPKLQELLENNEKDINDFKSYHENLFLNLINYCHFQISRNW